MLAEQPAQTVRVAAVGDLHCRPARRREIAAAFAAVADDCDLVLLAGDLTTHGEPAQGEILADACRALDVPVLAVLGNHDWHADRAAELTAVLCDAGITVLDREHEIVEVGGVEVGVAGLKGFVGGFDRYVIPDFGEPELRALYAETSSDVDALDAALRAIAGCALRIVLLHYAPVSATLAGEPPEIWAMLGSDRLAAPIAEHRPHLVLHGHAHAGSFAGAIGTVPVHNVSAPVIGRDFCLFELSATGLAGAVR